MPSEAGLAASGTISCQRELCGLNFAPSVMSAKPILTVGSIAIDWLELPDGRKGEVIGGSATYFTMSAGRFAPVHVVGVVGSDFPQQGMDIYHEYAANTVDLQTKDGNTFRWGGRYHSDWERRTTLYTELGVFESFSPRLSTENRGCPFVCLGNIQPALQLSVLNQLGDRESLVICDTMNLWIETTRDDLLQVLRKTDILLLNENEARLLTGVFEIVDAANQIRSMGPDTVVVKQGSSGATLVDDSGAVHAGVYSIERIVDPTGAGDCFAGGFVAALASGKSMKSALVAGSATASFCVEGFGTEGMLNLTEETLQKRMDVVSDRSEFA